MSVKDSTENGATPITNYIAEKKPDERWNLRHNKAIMIESKLEQANNKERLDPKMLYIKCSLSLFSLIIFSARHFGHS